MFASTCNLSVDNELEDSKLNRIALQSLIDYPKLNES